MARDTAREADVCTSRACSSSPEGSPAESVTTPAVSSSTKPECGTPRRRERVSRSSAALVPGTYHEMLTRSPPKTTTRLRCSGCTRSSTRVAAIQEVSVDL